MASRVAVHQVENIEIMREDGSLLKLRVYHPNARRNLPIVVNFHGGGFVIGSVDTSDASCRKICHRVECVVVSVEYRRAPEFPFPHGFNDAYLATTWVYQNATAIGGDPSRMVVMGDSAGGNFAAAVCVQNSNKQQEDFKLVQQVLIYPSVDLRPSIVRPSREQFKNGWFYTPKQSDQFRHAYMEDMEKDSLSFQASPFLFSGNMSRVPEAFILVAQFDPLRDEGIDYCKKLRDNNINVRLNTYEVTHGFIDMHIKEARRAHDHIVRVLRGVFYR